MNSRKKRSVVPASSKSGFWGFLDEVESDIEELKEVENEENEIEEDAAERGAERDAQTRRAVPAEGDQPIPDSRRVALLPHVPRVDGEGRIEGGVRVPFGVGKVGGRVSTDAAGKVGTVPSQDGSPIPAEKATNRSASRSLA